MFNAFRILLLTVFVSACTSPVHKQPAAQLPLAAAALSAQDPAELYGELFDRVQMAPVFSDSKEFVDMIPKHAPEVILAAYRQQKPATKEELARFVNDYFQAPPRPAADIKGVRGQSVDAHIRRLWKALTRQPHDDVAPASSMIALPYSYVVPGGRFREIYYWDSYFTQLGLLADGEDTLFQNMVKNFESLLLNEGRIPNGNRDYYRGRSQPPVFVFMIALWQERFGAASAAKFLPALKIEHEFWMRTPSALRAGEAAVRVVRIDEAGSLNRYWDDKPAPRPEAYKEDVELANKAKSLGRAPEQVYRDLRAAAESGWDFSVRWFADPGNFTTIQTTSYLPVDLNSFLFALESKIAELSRLSGQAAEADRFQALANQRRELVQKLMWDEESGTFRDYN